MARLGCHCKGCWLEAAEGLEALIRISLLDIVAAFMLVLGSMITLWAIIHHVHGVWLELGKLLWVILPGSYFCGRVLRSHFR